MIKRDELRMPQSCLNRADHNEPIFVLRAHDGLAAGLVQTWAQLYQRKKTKDGRQMTEREWAKYAEAMALAGQMDDWKDSKRGGDAA